MARKIWFCQSQTGPQWTGTGPRNRNERGGSVPTFNSSTLKCFIARDSRRRLIKRLRIRHWFVENRSEREEQIADHASDTANPATACALLDFRR